jgi:hypothetical protein
MDWEEENVQQGQGTTDGSANEGRPSPSMSAAVPLPDWMQWRAVPPAPQFVGPTPTSSLPLPAQERQQMRTTGTFMGRHSVGGVHPNFGTLPVASTFSPSSSSSVVNMALERNDCNVCIEYRCVKFKSWRRMETASTSSAHRNKYGLQHYRTSTTPQHLSSNAKATMK